VLLSEKLGVPWLAKADAVAASAVACIVVWVSVQLGRKTIDDLLDAVPSDLKGKVETAARGVDGVLDVPKVRLRRAGPEIFADVTLTVGRETPFERAHDIASGAEAAIRERIPGADVVVHTEPAAVGPEGQLATIRLVAARHGLGAHGVRVYDLGGQASVELHLEVDENLRLGEAHAKATAFEKELRQALPAIERVVSHIEPTGEGSVSRRAAPDDELPVREALEALCKESGVRFNPHDLKVQRVGEELAVSFHCAMDPETSIAAAHDLTEQMEKKLRERLKNLGRVTIHVEPPEDVPSPPALR
jgi:divalent metal cation (Fe/Co/Zn/Cd) transporter